MGPQQEVDGVAGLVDGAIQIFPLAIDLKATLNKVNAIGRSIVKCG
jgi:hypothetical protein